MRKDAMWADQRKRNPINANSLRNDHWQDERPGDESVASPIPERNHKQTRTEKLNEWAEKWFWSVMCVCGAGILLEIGAIFWFA